MRELELESRTLDTSPGIQISGAKPGYGKVKDNDLFLGLRLYCSAFCVYFYLQGSSGVDA